MTGATKVERLGHANAVLEEISKVGRRFFWSEKHHRASRFDFDAGGRLRLIDKHTAFPVYIVKGAPWRRFSDGGTLRRLVEALADYIRHDKPISPRHFGPWPEWICDGDLWGYGDAMPTLRATLAASPAVAQPKAAG